MADFELRDPIHKRIPFSAFERRIIDHPFFQRLRFIDQLSFLISYVYPGATHDRFSHSLGVMHTASRLIGRLRASLEPTTMQLAPDTWGDITQMVRLAGLLHDIGHGPFSHASEAVFPSLATLPLNTKWWKNGVIPSRKAKHEDYSVLLIQTLAQEEVLPDLLAQDIASLIHDEIKPSEWLEDIERVAPDVRRVCKALISGEMDADRMDYLLRDSYYCGVAYGNYDIDWLISSLHAIPHEGRLVLAISENAVRAFEDFLLARIHMIDQVYFHKTAVGFHHYLTQAFEEREIEISIPSDPYAYASLRDGRVIEALEEAAFRGAYWSKHLMRRIPPKHILRLHDANDRDKQTLASLVELCHRQDIGYFVEQSRNVLSRLEPSHVSGLLYVAKKTLSGIDPVPIEVYSDLLQKYNEKISFTDFYVPREEYETFRMHV